MFAVTGTAVGAHPVGVSKRAERSVSYSVDVYFATTCGHEQIFKENCSLRTHSRPTNPSYVVGLELQVHQCANVENEARFKNSNASGCSYSAYTV